MAWNARQSETDALERVLRWIVALFLALALLGVLVACAPVQVGPKELPQIVVERPAKTPPPLPSAVHLNFEPGRKLAPGDINAGGRMILEWWACLRHPEVKCPRS